VLRRATAANPPAPAAPLADPDTVLVTADHDLASAAASLGIEALIPVER